MIGRDSSTPRNRGADVWVWDDITPETISGLTAWADRIQHLIGAADTKAAALLGWSGTALTLVTTLLAGIGLPWSGPHLLSSILTLTGVILLGGCVVSLILAIRPCLSGPPAYGSFIGALDADSVIGLTLRSHRPDPTGAAAHIVVLTRIATRKHQRIQTATTLLLAACAVLVGAAVMGVLS